MTPESIKITDIDKGDLVALNVAIMHSQAVISVYKSQYAMHCVMGVADRLKVKVARTLLKPKVKSITLSREEFMCVMALADHRVFDGYMPFVRQIHPRVC